VTAPANLQAFKSCASQPATNPASATIIRKSLIIRKGCIHRCLVHARSAHTVARCCGSFPHQNAMGACCAPRFGSAGSAKLTLQT
jgi:hypothetical protein